MVLQPQNVLVIKLIIDHQIISLNSVFVCLFFCVAFLLVRECGGRVHAGKAETVKGDATLPRFCNSPLKSWYQTITSFPHTDSGLNTDGHSGT